jgi:hypothetical protein
MQALFLMIAGHALADFAFQSEAMARGKSRKYKVPPPDTEHFPHWFYWLTSHSLIHGGMVAVITGVWWLGLAEMVLHWITDYAKCEGWIGFHTDQGVHAGSKLLWWALLP